MFFKTTISIVLLSFAFIATGAASYADDVDKARPSTSNETAPVQANSLPPVKDVEPKVNPIPTHGSVLVLKGGVVRVSPPQGDKGQGKHLGLENGSCVFMDDIVIAEQGEEDAPNVKYVGNFQCEPGSTTCSNPLTLNRMASKISAASISILLSSLVTYPIDSMKLRKQLGNTQKGYYYKGFGPYGIAMCSTVAVGLATHDFLKEEGWSSLSAGAMGTLAAGLISNPLWIYRIKHTMADPQAPYTLSQFFRDMGFGFKKPTSTQQVIENVKFSAQRLFRGQGANLMALPPAAAYYHLYEQFDTALKKQEQSEYYPNVLKSDFLRHAFAGGGSRVASSAASYSLDTIRLYRQKYDMSYKDIIQKLNSEGGVKRFYMGFPLAAAKGAVGTALYMAVYGTIKQSFERQLLPSSSASDRTSK